MKYPIQVLFREYVEGIIAAILFALFLRFFVLSILYMPTNNMSPELNKGDFVVGWRLAYGFPLPLMKGVRLNAKIPQYGDMVSLRFPGDEEQILIRRVVARAGDQVRINQGEVFVNGQVLASKSRGEKQLETSVHGQKEYLTQGRPISDLKEMRVPEGSLFVLSDNRLNSDDSRDWGVVPVQNVESRVSLIWLSVKNSDAGSGFQLLWHRFPRWVN